MKMINYIFLLSILLLGYCQLTAQTTLKGFITQYEHGDTVISCKVFNTILILDENKEELYKEWKPFTTKKDVTDPLIKFRTNHIGSNDHDNGWMQNEQTSIVVYHYDTTGQRNYIIEDKDTTMTFKATYDDNGYLVREECLEGCNYSNDFFYNKDNLTKIRSNFVNDTSYTVYEYDEEDRIILVKMDLDYLDDIEYGYIKTSFKDQVRMKVEELGYVGSSDKEVITTFYSKAGTPVYETYEIYEGDDKIRWVMEYEKD